MSRAKEMLDEALAPHTGDDLSIIERLFDAIGLMRGPYAPFMRFAVGFGALYIVQDYLRPSLSYDNGNPRPWVFDPRQNTSGLTPTYIPWWFYPLGGGALCGLFV